MERRRKSRIGILFLGVCLLVLLMGMPASARNVYKSINLKQNKTVKQKEAKSKKKNTYYYYYRISVPGDGYITVNSKRGKGNSGIYFAMYAGLSGESDDYVYSYSETKKKTVKAIIPISKGVYYLKDSSGNSFSWKFTKVKAGSNYSPEDADILPAGKKVTICQTPDYHFDRWYRITLSSKKAITFWTEAGEHASIYDESFNGITVERAGSGSLKYFTSQQQEPGTYYLCIRTYDYRYTYWSDAFYYATLYWR